MTLPGETEAGSAGMQPAEGYPGGLIETMSRSAGVRLSRSSQRYRIERPQCLKQSTPL